MCDFEDELMEMGRNILAEILQDPELPKGNDPDEWREYYRKKTEQIPVVENPEPVDGEAKEVKILCGVCFGHYWMFLGGMGAELDDPAIACPHCGAPGSKWIKQATHSAGWFNSSISRRLE